METGDGGETIQPTSNVKETQPQKEKVISKKRATTTRPRSIVWDHFNMITVDGETKCKCKHCGREYYCDAKKNGTSSLQHHITVCMKLPARLEARQKLLNLQPLKNEVDNNLGSLTTWKFDQNAIRKALAHMIVVDELPFKFVEREGFKHLLSIACPRFKIPSRFTISRDCYDLYFEEKKKIQTMLKTNGQRVCLTTDTWTSIQRINYMCLTIHFIDNEWCLNKKIVNFCPVSSHKGADIGFEIENCLKEWGIQHVFTITMDNASSNDTAVKFLKEQLTDSGTCILKGEYLHMRCIAHIINLVVNDGLKEIGQSVQKIRMAVRFLRQSPARLKRFKECVVSENIQSKSLLCLDVATRWNSTYLMLNAAQKCEKAFNRYNTQDPSFGLELLSEGGLPSREDWKNIRRMITFLEHFYELTLRIFGTLYVTSNRFFHEIYMVYRLLKEWIKSDDFELSNMAMQMKVKYDKYWGDPMKMNHLIYIAVILDPRYKLEWMQLWVANMYDGDVGVRMGRKLHDVLLSLFNEYKKINFPSQCEQSEVFLTNQVSEVEASDTTTMIKAMVESEYKKYKSEKKGGNNSRTELDKYLNEETEDEDPNFDILMWWKINHHRFPILSQLARDVLAIPISTVASESAFSTGGRVLDTFRSSLTPKIAECLICCQDWLRNCKTIDIEEDLQELETLEKGLENLSLELNP